MNPDDAPARDNVPTGGEGTCCDAASRRGEPAPLVRCMRFMLIWYAAGNMIDIAALTLWSMTSKAWAIASLTGFREAIGWAMWASAALLLPLALHTVFPRLPLRARHVAGLAALGAMVAAFLWVGMAFISRGTELGIIRATYLRNGIEALAFALLIAATVNEDMRRKAGVRQCDFVDTNRLELAQ